MKKILMVFGLVVCLAQWSLAGGSLGLHASYWNADDLDEEVDSEGMGGGVKFQFDVADRVGLELRGSSFTFERDDAAGSTTVEIMPAEAGLALQVLNQGALSAYAGGGAGYYFMDAEFESGPVTLEIDIDEEIGFYAVAGVEFMFGKSFGLFAEGKHTWVDLGDVEDVSSGISLDGFGANAGLLVVW